MKRLKQLIVVIVCILMLSGCVKERITMNINKDKSMNLEYEMLVSDELMKQSSEEGSNVDLTEDAKELEKKGYTVTAKTENGYSGYTVTKKYPSIDKLSSENAETVELSDFLEEKEGMDLSKTFNVKKGFLKNTYTAKFTFEFDQDSYNMATEDEVNNVEAETKAEGEVTLNEEDKVPTTEAVEKEEEETVEGETTAEGLDDLSGLMSLATEMEFKYTVKLPYAAISNNATNVSQDKKTLTWNMATEGKSSIEFSFPIYNMTNLIILCGGCVLLLVIIIVVIVVIGKKKKGSKETLIHTDYDSSIVNQIDETTANQNEIPQGVQNHEVATPVENATPVAPVTPEVPASPMDPVVPTTPMEPAAPVAPQVDVTSGPTDETPTITSSIDSVIQDTIPVMEPQAPVTPQATITPSASVTQGPAVDPTMNQSIQMESLNMTPPSDINQNNFNQ